MVITNYGEVIIVKIKTCRSNFKSGGFNPWRSSDFDSCISNDVDRSSSGVEHLSGGDRSVGQQSEEGRRVERIMKKIKGSWVSEFCDTKDYTKSNKQKLMF